MSVDLTTTYLGLSLASPLVASAGPLTGKLDTLAQLEDAGVAAAVLPSLFEEQIIHEELAQYWLYSHGSDAHAESLTYFPELPGCQFGTDSYLRHIDAAKKQCSIPIIASLNGCSPGGWVDHARQMQDAGADAIELNIYFVPTDPNVDAAEVERRYLELVASVRAEISIPMAVKLGPQFSSLPHFALRLVEAGADGLVLFNRWLEPDIDLETLTFEPSLVLSQPIEIRTSLRWIAILRDHTTSSLAASSGVHSVTDVIKLSLVGADVIMLTSALLKKGPELVTTLRTGLIEWLAERGYVSVTQMKGSMSIGNCADPDALLRANYMKTLSSYTAR